MQTNTSSVFAIALILLSFITAVVCFFRIYILLIRVIWFGMKFRIRLAVVDPKAYETIYVFKGYPRFLSSNLFKIIKKYVVEKGENIDPELLELGKKINAPIKHGLLTVLLIPGGIIAVLAVVYFFKLY